MLLAILPLSLFGQGLQSDSVFSIPRLKKAIGYYYKVEELRDSCSLLSSALNSCDSSAAHLTKALNLSINESNSYKAQLNNDAITSMIYTNEIKGLKSEVSKQKFLKIIYPIVAGIICFEIGKNLH